MAIEFEHRVPPRSESWCARSGKSLIGFIAPIFPEYGNGFEWVFGPTISRTETLENNQGGETKTLPEAQACIRRCWIKWLDDSGLVEKEPTVTP